MCADLCSRASCCVLPPSVPTSFLLPVIGDFFFNDTATTEIYTLSLHDALPISVGLESINIGCGGCGFDDTIKINNRTYRRSEEHTSELQSHHDLVCRLLLEKKKIERRNHRVRVFFLCLLDVWALA